MTAGSQKIHVERLDVDRHVRHGLGRVDEHDRAHRMRAGDDLRQRHDRADRVRDVRQREQLDAGQQLVEVVELQLAVGVGGDEAQARSGLRRQQLPRHEIRMMLELRGQDRVARPEVPEAPRKRDQVDRFGRVARPYDLGRVGGVDEAGDLRARRLEGVGGAGRQLVNAAMDVRVIVLVIVDERVDHRARLLRRGGRIEIHQPAPARRRLRQDRKIGDDLGLLGIAGDDHAVSVAASILASSAVRISSRSASPGKRVITGSKKPSVIIRSASLRAMPRLET